MLKEMGADKNHGSQITVLLLAIKSAALEDKENVHAVTQRFGVYFKDVVPPVA